jgi:hypothetical protein
MRTILLTIILISVFGCGSTMPVFTKAEIAEKHSSTSKTFVKKGNYLDLARYWDENAKKQSINFTPASFLKIWEKERKAEISIGNGPYYGFIELRYIDENTTQITIFSWGGMGKRIHEWVDLICNYPE